MQQRKSIMFKQETYTYLRARNVDEVYIGKRQCLGKKIIMMPTLELNHYIMAVLNFDTKLIEIYDSKQLDSERDSELLLEG